MGIYFIWGYIHIFIFYGDIYLYIFYGDIYIFYGYIYFLWGYIYINNQTTEPFGRVVWLNNYVHRKKNLVIYIYII